MGLDCPINPAGEHKEPETPEKPKTKKPEPITPSNQLLQEVQEVPGAPVKPPSIFEPRRSQRSGRDLRPIDPKTHERIDTKETQSYEEKEPWYSHFMPRVNRIGHDEDHPTEQQVNSSPYAKEWAQARETERAKLRQYGVYEVIPKIPKGHRLVDTKWVYDTKRDQDGNLLRRRARKVGRGFTQEKGVNYGETFSQMSRSETWRILLTLTIQNKLAIRQWDVKAAYLQAPLSHEVYAQDINEDGEIEYWKLCKALYGLKQAGHEWYNTMRTIMTKTVGLTQSIGDPGCFYRPNGLILSTHVDDMVAIAPTEAELDDFEKKVETHVELDKLGIPKKLLGMELTWEEKGTVKLTQRTAIGNLAKEFEIALTEVPSKSLPLNPEIFKEPTNEEDLAPLDKYQSLVGSLLYIARHTRPEISIHVNLLGRRTSKASNNNMRAALQVLRYLMSTQTDGLTILKEVTTDEPINIQGFALASYGGEQSRSQSGSLILLYRNPITWSSRRQDTVAMSITEAEYIACSETAKDIRWLQQLLEEVTQQHVPAVMHVDNEAAIKLTKTQTFHRRSRHIEHRHHFIREMVDRNLIMMKGIAGKENPADPLTKLLPMSQLTEWTKRICSKTYSTNG